VNKRLKTVGGVAGRRVVFQRLRPSGSILKTSSEAKERSGTKCRIVAARGYVLQSSAALTCIAVRRSFIPCVRGKGQHKASRCEPRN
jgi:hypothetical protein